MAFTPYVPSRGPGWGSSPAPKPPPVAGPRPPAAPPNWLAPLTPGQIQTRASAAVGAQVNPILEQLKALFTSRSQQGMQAITGYTQALAGNLAPYMDRAKAAYGQAQQDQNAVDSAVSSELHGGGSKVAAALTSRLGEGFDPAMVAALGEKANATGAGSAGAQYAQGSAELSKLIGEGAHAEEYAGKLPGFAALTGLQNTKQLQAQLDNELATQTGDVTSKVPAAVSSLVQSMQGTELQKALAKQSGLFNAKKTNADLGYKQQVLQQRRDAASARTAATNAKTQASQSAAAAKVARPDATLSGKYGYVVDANGNKILRNGKEIPVASSAKAKTAKPLTVSEKTKATSTAYNLAQTAFNGGADSKGNQLPPITYTQAVEEARKEGLLADPRTAKITIAALQKVYGIKGSASSQVDSLTRHGLNPARGTKTPAAKFLPSTPLGH